MIFRLSNVDALKNVERSSEVLLPHVL